MATKAPSDDMHPLAAGATLRTRTPASTRDEDAVVDRRHSAAGKASAGSEKRRSGKTARSLAAQAAIRAREERRRTARSADPRTRERFTVQIAAGIIDRLRNAVYWTKGMTLAGFIENCIDVGVTQMENERGKPLPTRDRDLPVGRPPKKT